MHPIGPGGRIPDAVGAPGNSVAIVIVGVGEGQQPGLWQGFKQAQANHGGGDAQLDQNLVAQRAIAQVAKLDPWSDQRVARAVGIPTFELLPAQMNLCFPSETRRKVPGPRDSSKLELSGIVTARRPHEEVTFH